MKKKLIYSLLIVFYLVSCSKDSTTESKVAAPEKATLIYPDNNSACVTDGAISDIVSAVIFSWNASNNTDFYDLTITNLNTNSINTISQINATSKSVNLSRGTPYAWYITSKSSGTSKSSQSDTWQFYLAGEGIVNYAPFPADLVYPENGITVSSSSGTVNLSWTCVDLDSEELTYTLYFDAVDGLQTPNEAHTNLSATNIDVPVSANTTYYWRVVSSDGSNNSYSMVQAFRTD